MTMSANTNGIVWSELMSRDPEASTTFYREVLGLAVRTVGEGPGAYRMLLRDERPIGGMTGPLPDSEVWPSGGPAGHWVGYFATDSVPTAAARTTELGGKVLLGPLDLPGVGTVAVLRDPDDAVFGVFDPSNDTR